MPTDVKYTTSATATGGRDGQAKTEDGAFAVKLGVPKEMGGNGQGNNPEQMFAAGYSACFLGAMKAVASHGGTAKVPNDATVTATVALSRAVRASFSSVAERACSMRSLGSMSMVRGYSKLEANDTDQALEQLAGR